MLGGKTDIYLYIGDEKRGKFASVRNMWYVWWRRKVHAKI